MARGAGTWRRHLEPAQNTVDNTQNVEPIYRRRPFVQVHVCHSGTNLIAAEIEATAEGWARSVQSIGSYAGPGDPKQCETSLQQYLDSDIYPQFQNMKLVQSGLYSSLAMREHDGAGAIAGGAVAGGVAAGPVGIVVGAAVGAVAAGNISTNVLNNYAVGSLHDEVREMYQGNVYQTGNGFLRPRHLIHLIDAMRQLSGPVEVKEVTHAFGMGGFVTTWTPDCVAYAQDGQKGAYNKSHLKGGVIFPAVRGRDGVRDERLMAVSGRKGAKRRPKGRERVS